MVALRQMYDFSRPQGESCYRLLNRSGQFIYLKTRGFLEIDEKTQTVHSFVCVNTLVSEEEGKRLINEMKHLYSIIIDQNERTAVTNYRSDIPAIDNPQQLESAIMTLISNLGPSNNSDYNVPSVGSDSSTESDSSKGNTQLSMIAPQINTIKNTIFKSAGVLGTSSNKKIQPNAKTNNNKSKVVSTPPMERPSVLKMHGSYTQHSTTTTNQQHTTLSVYQETHVKYEPTSPLDSGRCTEYRSPNSRMIETRNTNDLYQTGSNNGLSPSYEVPQQSTSSNGRTSYKRTYGDGEGDFGRKRRNVVDCEDDSDSGKCLIRLVSRVTLTLTTLVPFRPHRHHTRHL